LVFQLCTKMCYAKMFHDFEFKNFSALSGVTFLTKKQNWNEVLDFSKKLRKLARFWPQ